MESITIGLCTSLNVSSVAKLYDRLIELPVPLFVGKRLKLPCIVFKLGPLSVARSRSGRVSRALTTTLGTVEITTEENPSRFDSLYLIYPWIDFPLDRQPVGHVIETTPEKSINDRPSTIAELSPLPDPFPSTSSRSRTARLASRFGLTFGRRRRDVASLQPPSTPAQKDRQKFALRVLARLTQPFGALLLMPSLGNVAAYRRVAAESLIIVRVEEITRTTLDKLSDSVRVLDVL